VEPQRVKVGGRVTIRGAGLANATAVLFGRFSATIVEKSADHIVFEAPLDPVDAQYSAVPYVALPGSPITSAGIQVVVTRWDANAPAVTKKSGVALDETGNVTADTPVRHAIDAGDARTLEVRLVAEGGEVEARLAGADEKEPDFRATYAGQLVWKADVRGLHGPLSLVLATDSKKPVRYHVMARRAASGKAPAAAPTRTPG
jgi:hypothetical protein